MSQKRYFRCVSSSNRPITIDLNAVGAVFVEANQVKLQSFLDGEDSYFRIQCSDDEAARALYEMIDEALVLWAEACSAGLPRNPTASPAPAPTPSPAPKPSPDLPPVIRDPMLISLINSAQEELVQAAEELACLGRGVIKNGVKNNAASAAANNEFIRGSVARFNKTIKAYNRALDRVFMDSSLVNEEKP